MNEAGDNTGRETGGADPTGADETSANWARPAGDQPGQHSTEPLGQYPAPGAYPQQPPVAGDQWARPETGAPVPPAADVPLSWPRRCTGSVRNTAVQLCNS